MNVLDRAEASIQFDLESFDTPERRERILADVRRAIGDTQFNEVMTLSMGGKPLVSAQWKKGKLVVKILKPKPKVGKGGSLYHPCGDCD